MALLLLKLGTLRVLWILHQLSIQRWELDHWQYEALLLIALVHQLLDEIGNVLALFRHCEEVKPVGQLLDGQSVVSDWLAEEFLRSWLILFFFSEQQTRRRNYRGSR